MLQLGLDEIEALLAQAKAQQPIPMETVRFLPPIDGTTEVWAAGVTYKVSREARVEESGDQDIYRRVYEAERPELFFKASAWRVVTDGEPIGVRADSPNNVPEPELGLVLNNRGDLVGFTTVDDVSSRSIEGSNPLYLPQAKVYDGSCALGPSITPRWLGSRGSFQISMSISRRGHQVFTGEASTAEMKRSFDELARSLFHQTSFPEGAVLATGTSLVPPMSQTLAIGDVVEIEIDGLARLVTPVAPAQAVGRWLMERRENASSVFALGES
jgi:2-dehydro-3-deoxy-D-arabinonate dehydratase